MAYQSEVYISGKQRTGQSKAKRHKTEYIIYLEQNQNGQTMREREREREREIERERERE